MILYHGSNAKLKTPRLIEQNKYLDFGNGFYTTSSKEQAKNFAKKVVARKSGKAIVNIYEIGENISNNLKVRKFNEPNDEWLDFVAENRSGIYSKDKYDIIIGAVANDDVYKTLQLYLNGVLKKQQALDTLKIKKLFNGYIFATEKALLSLKFINFEEV
jgi:hypothetical protein